jgi:2-dehydropantoate 2-reductase
MLCAPAVSNPDVRHIPTGHQTDRGSSRVLVVGGGAIGSVIAAHIRDRVAEVVVLDADAGLVRRVRSRGLVVEHAGGRRAVRVTALADPAELRGRFDFALLTVKATAIDAALAPLVDADVADIYVSLGNGLVQDDVVAIAGCGRVVAGVVEWGATNLAPGHVARTTDGPFTLGREGTTTPQLERLADVLEHVAPVVLTSQVTAAVWGKLLANSTFSGMGAISGLAADELAAHDDGLVLVRALWREGYRVARAAGVEPVSVAGVDPRHVAAHDPAVSAPAAARMLRRLGTSRSSMLQDLERGRRTEVDVINGGVVRTAERLGLRTPLNAAIVNRVHEIERAQALPSPAELDALRAAVEPLTRD